MERGCIVSGGMIFLVNGREMSIHPPTIDRGVEIQRLIFGCRMRVKGESLIQDRRQNTNKSQCSSIDVSHYLEHYSANIFSQILLMYNGNLDMSISLSNFKYASLSCKNTAILQSTPQGID
jgi:hypothetical protein